MKYSINISVIILAFAFGFCICYYLLNTSDEFKESNKKVSELVDIGNDASLENEIEDLSNYSVQEFKVNSCSRFQKKIK